MMMKRGAAANDGIPRGLAAILGCGILCLLALTARPVAAAPPFHRLAQDDGRLLQRINVRTARAYIGDLFGAVSRATGVRLIPGHVGDGTADFQLAVSLNSVTLVDFMESVWSMGSHNDAEWAWSREQSEPGEVSYRLWRPLRARRLPFDLRNQLQIDFEQQIQKLLALAGADEATRSRAAEEFPLARSVGAETRLGQGLVLIRTHVPPDQLRRVLRGGVRLSIRVAGLDPAGRRFLEEVWTQARPHRRNADGSLVPHAMPESIELSSSRSRAGGTPSLYLQLGAAGGYAYAGGTPLQQAWDEKLRDLWMLPGDQAMSPLLWKSLKPLPPAIKADPVLFPAAERFNSAAAGANFSYMALLPRRQRDPGDGKGLSLAGLLEKVPDTYYKFRNGVLLISYTGWFTENGEASNLPWRLHKELSELIRRRDGLLLLPDLFWLAARFPQAADPSSSPLTDGVGFLASPDLTYLLARCFHDGSFAARLKSGRVTLSELRAAAPAAGASGPVIWQDGRPESRLRLTDELIKPDEDAEIRRIMFLVQDPDDPRGRGRGFGFSRIDDRPADLTVSVIKAEKEPPAALN